VTIREQARADFNRLAAIGYIVRDDLHPEVQGAWRNAIVGVGHGRGLRIDMGRVGRKVWASVKRNGQLPDSPRMRKHVRGVYTDHAIASSTDCGVSAMFVPCDTARVRVANHDPQRFAR
jgi:hypothetical protein